MIITTDSNHYFTGFESLLLTGFKQIRNNDLIVVRWLLPLSATKHKDIITKFYKFILKSLAFFTKLWYGIVKKIKVVSRICGDYRQYQK